jgi:hypothetical protein
MRLIGEIGIGVGRDPYAILIERVVKPLNNQPGGGYQYYVVDPSVLIPAK